MLDQGGAMMRGGTIVDATIISAPSSTKNKSKERDNEMHQTRKGNEWYSMDVDVTCLLHYITPNLLVQTILPHTVVCVYGFFRVNRILNARCYPLSASHNNGKRRRISKFPT